VIRLVRRARSHRVTGSFLVHRDGQRWATPLLVTLLCLEASDIVFAIDGAVFALTRAVHRLHVQRLRHPGARSMRCARRRRGQFHLLRYGLAAVIV
jgi:tellurite resistance protein TerC